MSRLIFCLLYICNVVFVESIVVETTLGKVRGKLVHDDTVDVWYHSFTGIPYAEPPVGCLRWQPPVPKKPWCDVFDARKPGSVCPQTELYHSRAEMDEDCLNFNVYTPLDSFNRLLPVLFVIHGGNFDSQSGNAEPIYGPQLFLQKGVIVVTVNYRLGALGFLSLCTEDVSGNAGLKDVLLVLKVIHENIIRFGGDPNKVTVKGVDAGAVLATLLMVTNPYNCFFQTAMLHSGTFLSSKYIQMNPRENAIALARELGLDVSNNDCLVEKLKSIDAFNIVGAQEAISQRHPQRGFIDYKPFKPTVELAYKNAILTRPPLELMKEGVICDIPVGIGFNNQEGLEMFPLLEKEPELIDKLNKNFELLIPADIKYPQGSKACRKLTAQIRDFYFKGGDISLANIQNYINLISDCQYIYSVDFFIKLFEEKKMSPVYYYTFDGDCDLNWFKIFANITYPGAAHLDNIGYSFITSVTKPKYRHLDSTIKKTQDKIMQILTWYMYYGVPPVNVCWHKAGRDRYHFALHDCKSMPVYSRPIPERMGFWDSVYEEYFNSEYSARTYFCTNDDVSSVQ